MRTASVSLPRIRLGLLSGLGVVGVFLLTLSVLRAAERQMAVMVFEAPGAALLERLHDDDAVSVRWVESGVVIAELDASQRGNWPGRMVGMRPASQQLGILRATDRAQLKASGSEGAAARAFVAAHLLAEVSAQAGTVTLLVASPGTWPPELLGCHGGLVLPQTQVDPRTLLDRGAPPELEAWVAAGARPLEPRQQQRIAAVSLDTLQAYWDALRRNPLSLPADRWAFSAELENVYLPRVQTVMQRLVQGIPGASVTMQPFDILRHPPGTPVPPDTISVTTHNAIARIPGSVPGTGTFVVGAHVDATGSRNQSWNAAVAAGIPVETPGAEDNATGVACVLEMLRNVADAMRADSIAFAFDLEFVAFSGEEVGGLESGLAGSRHYVAERRAAGTKLLGIFNMDMVGSDSLGNNLQIVHNRASTWMVSFVNDAVAQVTPPIDLTLTPELDEALASDHNSFWAVGSDGILGADASVSVLRNYASYHRPTDTGADVSVAKMQEVTRAFLAALMQFEVQASTAPDILFPSEKLRLLIDVQGQEYTYVPTSQFHQLYPGETRLKALVGFYNLGATYADTVRVQMQTQQGASVRTVLDTLLLGPLVTGTRVDVRLDPVPLLEAGDHSFVARVTSRELGGGQLIQSSSLPYTVLSREELVLKPNPATELADIVLVNSASETGNLFIEVYTLEGERVASRSGTFTASQMQAGVEVLDPGTTRLRVVSGAYLVRVRWTGVSGGHWDEVLTAVVRQ